MWHLHAQPCHNVVSRGRAAPPKTWQHVSLQELEALAEAAAEKASAELGEPVLCKPLGQVYGPRSRRQYRLDPSLWRVPAGDRHSHQNLGWHWLRPSLAMEEITEQLCHLAAQRGVARPKMWSWAEVLQRLESLALEAGEKMSRVSVPEFGISVGTRV